MSSRGTDTIANENLNSNDEDSGDFDYFDRINRIKSMFKSSDTLKMSIAYIAGTIEDKIEKSGRFECGDCLDIFSDNDKISEIFTSEFNRMPCQSTFDICNIAYKYVQNLSLEANYTYEQARQDILREVDVSLAFSGTNFEGHESLKDYFIDFIICYYIQIQATYIAKKVTLEEQTLLLERNDRNQRKYKHFSGQ